MGLSTAYGIIMQSSGFIWVESEPERSRLLRRAAEDECRAGRPGNAGLMASRLEETVAQTLELRQLLLGLRLDESA